MAAGTISKIAKSLVLVCLFASSLLAQDQFLKAAYDKAAQESTDFFFIGRSELDENTFDQIRLLKAETLLNASYKTLTEEDETSEVSFIFDPTLNSFLLIAGARELKDFKLLDEKGEEVEVDNFDFVRYSFINQRIVSGTLDGPGPYKAVITGKGESAITVRARLKPTTQAYDFKALKAEFGKLEAFIRYSQYAALNRPPQSGEDLQCTLFVKTPSEELEFELVSVAGDIIETPKLEFVSKKRTGTIFRGPCLVPEQPFRYRLFRLANNERAAQRLMPEVIEPLPKGLE